MVFVTSARSLATYRGKVINRRDANPSKACKLWQEDANRNIAFFSQRFIKIVSWLYIEVIEHNQGWSVLFVLDHCSLTRGVKL